MKVVSLTNYFTPNRVPLWNAISDLCEFTILFLAPTGKVRTWDLSFDQLRPHTQVLGKANWIHVRSFDWALSLPIRSVIKALDNIRPDALIIGGYENPGYWAALRWARKQRVPVVLWFGSTLLSSRTSGNFFVDGLKRRFITGCDAYYTYGRHAGDYLDHYGANPDSIIVGTNHTNEDHFPSCARIGVYEKCSLLYVGRLIGLKGVIEMFHALSRITDLQWTLTVAGDGELRQELDLIADHGGFADRIKWEKFVQQKDLSKVYRSSDVLVMPSLQDVWGLVVNEGLLSGLYVIGSDRAAASLELIERGMNGDVVPPEPQALESALRRAINLAPFNRHAIRKTIASVSASGEAKKLMTAIGIAANNRKKNISSLQIQ
jgi:glycosyltransferase involved in cell wall biosynthesis